MPYSGEAWGHGGQALELAHGLLLDFLRYAGGFQLLAELFGVFGGFVGLAELFLDGLELLAQVEFALALRELALHLGLDAAAQLEQFELAGEVAVDFVEALPAIEHFEQALALRGGEGREVAGHEIGQAAGLGDAGGGGGEVVGEVGGAGHDLLEQAEHVLAEGLDFGGDGRLDIGDALDAGAEVGVGSGVFQGADAGDALTEQQQVFLGDAQHFVEDADGADLVHVGGAGGVDPGIELGNDAEGTIFPQRLDQRDGAGAADGDGQERAGEDYGIANREHRHFFNRGLLFGGGRWGRFGFDGHALSVTSTARGKQ